MLGLRDLLTELGHPSWVKTSGSKGFHVVVRLRARATFDDSSALAYRVAGISLSAARERLTQEFSKADRDGRIFVDIGRNRAGATFVAAYSVRAKPGAPVSAPCTWKEIEEGAVHPRRSRCGPWPSESPASGTCWHELASARPRAKKR